MSAFSRRPMPVAPRRLPRGARVAAVTAALLLAGLPATAQAPVPPAGTLTIVALVSDGMTLLPVATGVLPVTCEVVE